MPKTKKLAYMSLLTAIALTIFVLEAQIPAIVPIPGVKPGLANIITLVAIISLSRRDAFLILTVRLILGAMFTGSVAALMYSAAGGMCAFALMCVLVGIIDQKRLWVISALAAIAHNLGQIVVAVLVLKTTGILIYAPVLVASGIVSGVFTGLAAMYVLKALRKTKI